MVKESRPRRQNEQIKTWLENLYSRYHRTEWIGSDPVKFVHQFRDPPDQEIVGLIAASLAYGNVTAINQSISRVLDRMENEPRHFLQQATRRDMEKTFAGFRHRWTGEQAMVQFLSDIQRTILRHGSLGALFTGLDRPDADISETLGKWVGQLQSGRKLAPKELLADPTRGSACKRLNLYLRWMVRKDGIDPGCWAGISTSRLLVPLDTHVFGIAKACGFTRRAAADGKAVREITAAFQAICPEDPVRYDFALTRPGIVDGWKPGRNKPWLIV
jgi:uncharacterized protein (TIGR02757 family)